MLVVPCILQLALLCRKAGLPSTEAMHRSPHEFMKLLITLVHPIYYHYCVCAHLPPACAPSLVCRILQLALRCRKVGVPIVVFALICRLPVCCPCCVPHLQLALLCRKAGLPSTDAMHRSPNEF
jgi:hypothetical protein